MGTGGNEKSGSSGCPRAPAAVSSRASRRRREGGASLIEAAIVAPVILFIVLAMVEIAFTFRSASITTSASRAGARVAASTYGSTTTQAQRDATQLAVTAAAEDALNDLRSQAKPVRLIMYEADAAGLPASGSLASCTSSCVEFLWDATAGTFVKNGGNWANPDNCGVVLDRVGIYIEVEHKAFSPVLSATFDVDERTVMRLEPGVFETCTGE